ncbi:NAD-dependent epimerase/dehydratase family protein [Pseudofrankia saprophytica]|uniref:NAD-dependent epimerase/dehydratase family protein n=1 Tax=Pseudofrankia saprophytica TaxID=298655 RepID=UPI000234BC4F|nr:NAD-dependent epimerase/dehydratase family protein [Pseudofrankia saprophytica]
MRVLVVGGTGPSGPHVVRGLAERGHEVTIFHRGTHEPPEARDHEHLHGDPHFRESIDEALGTRTFDAVLAMYGRVQHLAPALRGRCDQFVSVGGVPVYRGYFPRPGSRLAIPVEEDDPLVDPASDDPALRFSGRLAEAERAVFAEHPRGTVLRYPMLYGPNNARPHEWSVVRRIRDRRPFMILPDGGIQVHTRCAVRNAAAFVLAAVDRPAAAAGQVFNCGDPVSWSFRDWAQLVARLMGAELDIVALPRDVAIEATTSILPLAGTTAEHCVLSTEKARHVLGYQPAVDPVAAMAELLAWYDERPDFEPGANPSFTDRFDYATEDALVAHYRAALRRLGDAVEQRPAAPAHSMPHPQRPGLVDDRGR